MRRRHALVMAVPPRRCDQSLRGFSGSPGKFIERDDDMQNRRLLRGGEGAYPPEPNGECCLYKQ
jgi:hypothetical protein